MPGLLATIAAEPSQLLPSLVWLYVLAQRGELSEPD